MSIGDFPESLGQAMLIGTMLVGRLGVQVFAKDKRPLQKHMLRLSSLFPQNINVDDVKKREWTGVQNKHPIS